MTNTVESKNMTVQVIWNIRDARGINANEKTFLFVVASRGIMYSEWQTAAADMGMSKDTYYRTRSALIKKGLIKEGLRKDTTTVYRIEEKALAALVPVKETTSEDIVWLEVEEPEAQKPAEKPVEVPAAQEDPEPVSEPQEATQAVVEVSEPVVEEMTDEQADYYTNLDPFAEEIAEDEKTANRILDESDDPVEARRLFNDKTWVPTTTDTVKRAAAAAFKVEKVLETVPATKPKTVVESFDEEW